MRLVTRTIWRAFPELDRFDDARCARFVRAAKRSRSFPRRLWWWGVQATVVSPIVFVAAGVILLLQRSIDSDYSDLARIYTALAIQAAVVVVAVLCALLVWIAIGHVFLRFRIEWVLRARGRCSGCGYVLVGLPVSESCHVICPECQLDARVDPSLVELSEADGGGVPRYAPSPDVLEQNEPWIKRLRVRKWAKRAGVTAGILLLVAGALWGWHEWRINRQAVRAAALKPGTAGLLALMEKSQVPMGGLPEGTPNAFDLLPPIIVKLNQGQSNLYPQGLPLVEGVSLYLGGEWAAARPYVGEEERGLKERLANEPYSTALLAEYERIGVFSDLRKMVDAPLAIGGMNLPKGQPLFSITMGDYAAMRRIARWSGGRMRQALRDDDPDRFADTLELTLGLSRQLEKQPVLLGRLVAIAIEALAYGELRAAISERHDARWLDAYERAWKKYEHHGSRALPYDGERVFSKDMVCWVFSDPARVRLGKYSPALQSSLGGAVGGIVSSDGRLGDLDENLKAFDDCYDRITADVELLRYERANAAAARAAAGSGKGRIGLGGAPAGPSQLLMVNLLMPAIGKAVSSQDQIDIDRVAIPLLLKLERYRLENGAYPQNLSELAPRWVTVLPVDPWSGTPFGYRLVDPTTDEQKRGFLLYTYGSDGVDNGGVSSPTIWDALHGRGVPSDYIINNSRR